MKPIFFFIILFLSLTSFQVEKDAFYNAFSNKSVVNIDNMLLQLEKEKETPLNIAYKGALLAKKAEFEKSAVKKIQPFKEGVQLLETQIKKFPEEVEYRFLRLCVQENCPDILKYKKNINEDIQLIVNNFSNQSKQLKMIIANYAKNSKSLDSTLLK